jgi:hypothetical protein
MHLFRQSKYFNKSSLLIFHIERDNMGVNLSVCWYEDCDRLEIQSFDHRLVSLPCPWACIEVLFGSKLSRIYKERNDIIFLLGMLHLRTVRRPFPIEGSALCTQVDVANVESAHHGHQANGEALQENVASSCVEYRDVEENLHLLPNAQGWMTRAAWPSHISQLVPMFFDTGSIPVVENFASEVSTRIVHRSGVADLLIRLLKMSLPPGLGE